MKKTLLLLVAFASFFACCSKKEQTITMAQFDRLVKADSIKAINVMNDEKVLITKRSASPTEEKLVMLIPSGDRFENVLEERFPQNKISSVTFVHQIGKDRLFFNLSPLLLGLLFLVLFLVAVIDILKNRFRSDIEKLIWVLVVIFVPLIGPVLYWIIGRKQRVRAE